MVDKLLKPKWTYPLARRAETMIEDYHGNKIPDPYRWLEDPDSEETKKYVDKLNLVSRAYINKCPIKEKIKNKLQELWDYPKYGCPHKEGSSYFYYHNTGLQNQSVLYKLKTLDAKPEVFLDPNLLSEDGTTAITLNSYSDDGSLFAYGLSEKGSDWVSVKFKKTADGSDLPDRLERLRYSSLEWTSNNKGVFYNRFPDQTNAAVGTCTTKNEFHQLFYHYLGKNQSEDILCVEFPKNPDYMIGARVTEDGQFLVVTVGKGCDPENLVYYYDLGAVKNEIKGKLDIRTVVGEYKAKFDFVSNDGFIFTFTTDFEAPMFKLIQIDVKNPSQENWKTLVAEEKNKLDWACRVNGDFLILCYIEDVKHVLHIHDLKTGRRLHTLSLDIGSIASFSGKKKSSEIFYKFQSLLTPGITYHLDLSNLNSPAKVFRESKLKGIKIADFEVKQVFYQSKDKTNVPMYIMSKKGTKLDGTNPTLVYGYGGFNVSLMPFYSVLKMFFVRYFNGIVAIPNIRGGDEYGKSWHEQGMKDKKQNVFNDFIAASEYLIAQKYTSRDKLVIEGHSNGGLLTAACLNQRPDLFGCVLSHVGVMDMLRFHNFTIGQAWVPEFGCSSNKNDFDILIKYSPLHNLKAPKKGEYFPAVYLSTADHDDRVVPLHSLKYMAQLYYLMRDIEEERKPVVIRIDVKAGHGAGKPTGKVIEEGADEFAFLYSVLDLKWCE